MIDQPAVLVLVANADRREAVRRRLTEFHVVPVAVRAARATEAIAQLHPIAVVIDEAHAATAPDEFLAMTGAHRVRLVTLPDTDLTGQASDAMLRRAALPRTVASVLPHPS